MKKIILMSLFVLSACGPKFDPGAEETAIRELMMAQQKAWNNGNVEEFMEGYWKSDSLMFVGSKITHGWDSTIANYHKRYPDPEAMGQLTFTLYNFRFIGSDACVVTGRFHLKRISDDPTGMFTLLLRKKDDKWLIVYDHTS